MTNYNMTNMVNYSLAFGFSAVANELLENTKFDTERSIKNSRMLHREYCLQHKNYK
jgi:hypothetical protein